MSREIRPGLISVLIASMGRASLRQTLESVARAQLPDGYSVEIVVADDSPDGAAGRIVAQCAIGLPLTLVPVGARNASIARNACLDGARGEWLAFVDDDETVDSLWLMGLVEAAREFAADGVFGPVRHLYPEGTPDWFGKADPMFYDLDWKRIGHRAATGHTANALIRHATLARLGMRFDAGFGRSGGEDDDLFRRMSAAGARLVVTDRAVVFEQVPAARATKAYIMIRAIRGGQTYGKITLRDLSGLGRLRFGLEALTKLVLTGAGGLALYPFDRARAFRLRIRAAANWGKLLALTDAPLKSSWS
ncbi:MAG: glycosyltransferase [Alphaproteobacteria bacterium]|nr:glycosyltransferase [Alphaproteobacteria bacterium]